jgi:hypothetical protein
MDSRGPSTLWPRPAAVTQSAAARRALGEHDLRSRLNPATRDALGRASAVSTPVKARSIGEPWSTFIDRAANMLSQRATRHG